MSCSEQYQHMSAKRETFLSRARECAKVTIPTLMPLSTPSSFTVFSTPYQGVGARGVNNLASKLLLALLPPNSPFFRLQVDDYTLEEIAGDEAARADVEEALNKIERAVMTEIETQGLRSPVFEALKHLITSGNCAIYLPKQGGARVFSLDRYVVKRDPMGEVLSVIIREEVSPATLEPDVAELLEPGFEEEKVEIFTKMERRGSQYHLFQEIEGEVIPGTEAKYPIEKAPLIALRWTRIDGEDYGRSYVEEYLGDLISLEGLSQAILEGSAASAKIIFLVNPNGTTKVRDIATAENGAILTGRADEVSVLQANKQADLRVAQETAATITRRLEQAFLMNTSVQRAGERVTAEEIRFMAGELEDALGGVYSILSQEFQLPFVARMMDRMQKQRRIPTLPRGIVRPAIVTGLEALGRGHDLQKLNLFMKSMAELGPEAQSTINMHNLISRVGTSLGIDMSGLVKSQEDIQQEQQQQLAQMQQQQMIDLAGKAVPNAVNAVAGAVQQGQS